MQKNTINTIIIGCGVSGIGCANQLTKNKKDFLIITEDIGGRITSSPDSKINYGAYFVLNNYKHILQIIKKGDKLHPFSVEFHDKWKRGYHLVKMLAEPIETLRLLRLLYRFKSRYEKFKKLCETQSQKMAIEKNPYLKNLYLQSATEFVKKEHFEKVAKKFLAEGVYMCTFLPLSKISAFDFMRLCLALIMPAYEFTFLKEEAIRQFKNKIIIDSVKNINKKDLFEIQTKNGLTYRAHNLVLATPPHITQKLLKIKTLKSPANAYVFHIDGKIKPEWNGGQYELFNNELPIIFIRKQHNGTYIFYSKIPNPKLEDYFFNPKIIFKKYWEPAFNISGDELMESKQTDNFFIIGDYNIIGLEDSYITGLFAANQITKNYANNN